MASIQISNVEKIDINNKSMYKLHLEVGGNSYGTININENEIEEDKIYDLLYQKSIIREFMHRREISEA